MTESEKKEICPYADQNSKLTLDMGERVEYLCFAPEKESELEMEKELGREAYMEWITKNRWRHQRCERTTCPLLNCDPKMIYLKRERESEETMALVAELKHEIEKRQGKQK